MSSILDKVKRKNRETKKVTDSELEKIRDLANQQNSIRFRIGDLEIEKLRVIQSLERVNILLTEERNRLAAKYGEGIDINLETGSLIKPNGKD